MERNQRIAGGRSAVAASRPHVERLLHTAAATLAAGVAFDSTTEHYRAGFHNHVMFVAPVVAAAAAVTCATAALRPRNVGRLRSTVLGSSLIAGLVGLGFHVRNTSKRVGGWTSSSNVFYGAPVAAPLAVTMAGALGLVASRGESDRRSTQRAGALVAALATSGLAGTAVEAGSLHFRGAFQNPAMYAPVVVPPLAAAALATAALTRSPGARQTAAALLCLTAALGVVGTAFHAWGVHRRMGGWRNWRQNLLAGPPLPAPPAFTGLSLAGLASLHLLEPRETR